jgi:hypothetical protein
MAAAIGDNGIKNKPIGPFILIVEMDWKARAYGVFCCMKGAPTSAPGKPTERSFVSEVQGKTRR